VIVKCDLVKRLDTVLQHVWLCSNLVDLSRAGTQGADMDDAVVAMEKRTTIWRRWAAKVGSYRGPQHHSDRTSVVALLMA
jgi:hypothetical protein